MRQQHSHLPVQLDDAGRPLAVLWDGQFLPVSSVIDSWEWAGDWVNGVSERRYLLISLHDAGILELYEELSTGQWLLSRVQD